jgi:hypothetical protein
MAKEISVKIPLLLAYTKNKRVNTKNVESPWPSIVLQFLCKVNASVAASVSASVAASVAANRRA